MSISKVLLCVLICGMGSCSGEQTSSLVGSAGGAKLALTLSTGVKVNVVEYKISGGAPPLPAPLAGTVDVADPGATVTFFLGGLPSAKAYNVDLIAKSTDGKTTCVGNASFDVEAGNNTRVTVPLQCRGDAVLGNVSVSGDTNNCPTIASVRVSPLVTPVGGVIKLSATTTDLDLADLLSLSWSALSGGTIGVENSGNSSFVCGAPGPATLVLSASDGKCITKTEVVVTCATLIVPGPCGNGFVDPGEECDAGPVSTDRCTSTCKLLRSACEICEAQSCNPATDGCQLYSGTRRILCQAWVDCILGPKGNNCSSNGSNVTPCFCGTATDTECLTGLGEGQCRDEGFAAAESLPCAATEAPSACNLRRILEVAERFRDPAYPIGGGTNAVYCYGESCRTHCFF